MARPAAAPISTRGTRGAISWRTTSARFVQDDWRVGGGLTLNAGLRYDIYGNFTERNGRIGNYYLPDAAATLGVEPGFQVPANAPFFQPGFTPLSIGLVVDPGTPIDLSQIHAAKYDSTIRGDYNNVAPRVGFAWQPTFAPKLVVRGGWGVYYERTGASYKRDLQLSAPFFFYQNVPLASEHGRSVSAAQRQPVPDSAQRPDRARRQRRAALGARRRHARFRRRSPSAPRATCSSIRCCARRTCSSGRPTLQYELRRGPAAGRRATSDRAASDLLGKVNLAVPVDPRVTPVNGFTDIYDRLGRLINPDFFVPAEFLGLSRNAGFQQLTNVGRSTYHSLQAKVRARIGPRARRPTSPTR